MIVLVFCVFLLLACAPPEVKDNSQEEIDKILEEVRNDPRIQQEVDEAEEHEDPKDSEGLTHKACEAAGGHWNECGSPCAGTGAEVCIQSCEVMCECGGIAGFGCPEGFSCKLSGKIADEMGRCVNDPLHTRES